MTRRRVKKGCNGGAGSRLSLGIGLGLTLGSLASVGAHAQTYYVHATSGTTDVGTTGQTSCTLSYDYCYFADGGTITSTVAITSANAGGPLSFNLDAENGGVITFSGGGTITSATGNNASSARALGTGSNIHLTDFRLEIVNGIAGAFTGGVITVDGTTTIDLTRYNPAASLLSAGGAGSKITMEGNWQTTGAGGVFPSIASVDTQGIITISGGAPIIGTTFTSAATGGVFAAASGGSITADGQNFDYTGQPGFGPVNFVTMQDSASVLFTNSTIAIKGGAGRFQNPQGHITYSGTFVGNSALELRGTTITIGALPADGLTSGIYVGRQSAGNTLKMTDSTIAMNDRTDLLFRLATGLQNPGGALTVTTLGASHLVGSAILEPQGSSTAPPSLTMDLGGQTTWDGDISVQAQSVAHVTLSGTSTWTGAATDATTVSVGTGTTWTVTGNSSLTGTLTNDGTVKTAAGALALTTGGVTLNTLGIFDTGTAAADSLTVSGVVSGAGALTKNGAGNLILTGANTYQGATTVNAGTLTVNGSLSTLAAGTGTLTVNSGGTLAGGQGPAANSGTIGRDVVIASGGTLYSESTTGGDAHKVTINGNFTLNAGGFLNYHYGTSADALQIAVSGAAALNGGTVNITAEPGVVFNKPTYGLMQAGAMTGTLANLTFNGVPTGYTQTMLGNRLYLTAVTPGTFNYWNGTTTAPTGSVVGGPGTWRAAASGDTNWTNAGGTLSGAFTDSSFAVFAGAGGTVQVDTGSGAINVSGMSFLVDGYTLTGDAINLVPDGTTHNTVIAVGSPSDTSFVTTINTPLTETGAGTGILVKQGGGTLVLAGVNSYSGGTVLEGGKLQVSVDGQLGAAAGSLTFNGGTLRVSGGTFPSTTRTIVWGDNGGGFDIASPAATFTVAQALTNTSGTSSLSKYGPGTLVLSGANTYRGGTFIYNGTLQVSSGGNLGTGVLTFDTEGGNTGTLHTTGSTTFAQAVTMTAAGTFETDTGADLTLGGTISGPGAITKTGAGNLILTADSAYSGPVTVSAGQLHFGNNTAAGGVAGNITLATGTGLVFNRTGAVEYSAVISGAGVLAQSGTGTLTLTNTNTYSGGTIINAGTISISSAANLGAAPGGLTFANQGGTLQTTAPVTFAQTVALNANGTFDTATGADLTLSGDVSGAGSLTKINTGTLTLTGTNGYTGGTSIDGGIVSIAAGANLGTGALTFGTQGGNTGTLQTTAGPITLAQPVAFNAAGAIDNVADLTLAGQISGTGAMTKNGTGNLILTADSLYSGAVTVNTGELHFGNGGPAGNIQGPVDLAGNTTALIFDRTTEGVYPGAITGVGSMTQRGTGKVTLTGDSTYTGGTTIAAGSTLQLGNNTATGSVTGDITNEGNLTFYRSNDLAYNDVISGAGSVTKLGAGTLELTNTNTYTGPTTISAGTLAVNGSINSATTIQGLGTLSGIGTITGDVSNSGTIAPGNPVPFGTLTIAGNYVGNDGTYRVRSALAGDSSPSDQLVITGPGNSASGTTRVQVTNVGGAGGPTTNGIPIVLAQNGATTAPTAFVSSKPPGLPVVSAGAYGYELFRGPASGGTAAEQSNWYLRSTRIEPAPPPVCTGPDCGNPPPPPANNGPPINPRIPRYTDANGNTYIPLYRPEVPIYGAMPSMVRAASVATMGSYHDRHGNANLLRGTGTDGVYAGAWGRAFGEHVSEGSNKGPSPTINGNTVGFQIGADLLGYEGYWGQDRAGLFAGYARSTADVRGFAMGVLNYRAGNANLDATSVGAYWTHIGPSGWYADAVAMGTRYDSKGISATGANPKTHANGFMGSLEMGYPIQLGMGGLTFEPQAQVVYSHIDFENRFDGISFVDLKSPDSVRARIGGRFSALVDLNGVPIRPFLQLNLWKNFAGADEAIFNGFQVIPTKSASLNGEVAAGIEAQIASNVSLFGSGGVLFDMGKTHLLESDRRIWRGNAGLRVTW